MSHWSSPVIQGLFGNTAASQSGGLFGAAQTSTATGFGTGTGLFGQTNTGFGNVATQVPTRDDLKWEKFSGPQSVSLSVTGDNYFSIRTETSVQYSVLGKVMLCNKSGQVPMKQCFFSSLVMVSLLETTHMALLQLDCQIQQKEFHVIHLYVKDIILKAQFGF